jgi:hypothetical protein
MLTLLLLQGFTKPHDHTIRKSLNMFDQPFRQHYASATGMFFFFHPEDLNTF